MSNQASYTAAFLVLFLSALIQAACFSAASAQCQPPEVWAVFPDSKELATAGPINDKLKTQSGPTVNKDGTQTYARRWTGGSASRGVSVTLTFYFSAQLAAQKVRAFGLKKDGSLAPDITKLGFGDEGYAISSGAAGMIRPVFMVQIKNLVVFYYSSNPTRKAVPDQTAIVRDICLKAAKLPCLIKGAPPTPPPPPPKKNTCPTVKTTISPKNRTAGQKVIISSEAVDPDGDKVEFTWRLLDYQNQPEASLPNRAGRVSGKGKANMRLVWPKAPGGRYLLKWTLTDGACPRTGAVSFKVGDPGRANGNPNISLSFSPPKPQAGQMVTVTGRIKDPDGDAIKHLWQDRAYDIPPIRTRIYPTSKKGDLRVSWRAKLDAGLSRVCLKAYDSFGGRATKCVEIMVNNPKAPLTVKLISDKTRTVSGKGFNLTAVANNPTGGRLAFQWTVDGKKTSWQGPKAVWAIPPVGSHLVEVLVSQWGGGAAKDALRLTVDPPPAAANQKPVIQSLTLLTPNPRAGSTVSFTAKAMDPDPGDRLSYAWSLDGAPLKSTGARAAWPGATAGTHRVRVVVTDGKDRVARELAFKVKAVASLSILNAMLCENPSPQCSSHVSEFLSGQSIHLWLEGKSTGSPQGLRVLWISPHGQVAKTDQPQTPPAGRWNLTSVFTPDSSAPLGQWRVEIYLGGTKMKELGFNLVREKVMKLFSRRDQPGPGCGLM